MPQSLVPKERQTIEARIRAYKNAAFCLEDFAKAYLGKDGELGLTTPRSAALRSIQC